MNHVRFMIGPELYVVQETLSFGIIYFPPLSFSISQMEITGKNFEKRTMAKMKPAESPAIIDHSTHEGI
jgi:hypothetical protein